MATGDNRGAYVHSVPAVQMDKLDEALDWAGVLAEIHGLLPTAYRLWYKRVTGRHPPPPPMASDVAGHEAPCDFAAVLDTYLGDGNVDEGDGGARHI